MYADPTGEIASWIIALVVVLVIATVNDITKLNDENIIISDSDNDDVDDTVKIENSNEIVTPWVQYGHCIYLNYFNEETKDIIDGTSIGMQFEWELHNIVYGVTTVFGLENDQFKDVDLGRTMFEDNHGWKSYLMFGAYFCRNSLGWFIDLITNYN